MYKEFSFPSNSACYSNDSAVQDAIVRKFLGTNNLNASIKYMSTTEFCSAALMWSSGKTTQGTLKSNYKMLHTWLNAY